MTKQELLNKLEETQKLFAGLAGYYGLRNYKREQDGKRKSATDDAKEYAYGFCADDLKRIIEEAQKEETI